MPKIVRTARGEQIDFDTIIIKQQLAQAPMNIEVARRKEFIDSKEGKVRGSKIAEAAVDGTIQVEAVNAPAPIDLIAPDIDSTVAPTSKKKIK